MKQRTDWTERVRQRLRETELAPPERGWERIEAAWPAPEAAPTRRMPLAVWRRRRVPLAAAAAAGLLLAAFFLYPTRTPISADPGIEYLAANGTAGAADREAAGNPSDKAAEVRPDETARDLSNESAGGRPDKTAGERHSIIEEQQPTSDERQPETDSRQPAADNRQPAADRQQPTADSRQPTTGSRTRPAGFAADRRAYAEAAGGQSKPIRRSTRRVALALFGSGSLQNGRTGFRGLQPYFDSGIQLDASFTAIGSDLSVRKQNDYAQSTFDHRRPWSIGVSLRHDLGRGCSLETGFVYTYLYSEVTTHGHRNDQRLHFVGIPLRLQWAFVDRPRVGLYIGAGGLVERCVSARLGGERRSENRLQGSIGALLGAEYRFSSHAALYFEPEWSYYLTDTRLRTIRTDDPGATTLRVGIRFGF